MRTALSFLVGLLVGATAVWLALGGWPSVGPPSSVPTAMAPGGQVREFRLDARPARWELLPGLSTDAWTYNGTVPGPELRVREGDLVRVVLTNHLPVPTTIHWHGVDVPNAMDGVPGLTQEPVPPGGTFTYQFVASPAGTRMYHSHQDSNAQMELGLYGALIIEPRRGPRYDLERTLILDERALDFTPAVAEGRAALRDAEAGNGRGGAFQYDLFLMDGKAASAIPPITVRAGQRVLLRLLNLGNLPHAIHLHGHTFTIVATDGNPVPPAARLQKDTVLIGPGERYDLEVLARNPGVWMLHCHMPNHSENGMMTLFQYEGYAPLHGAVPGQFVPLPGGHGEVAARPAPRRVVTIRVLDNRFAPSALTIPAGTTVQWVNRGQNLHTTTSLDGTWDSPDLERGRRYAVTFARPGTYRYLCRQHLLQGMLGTITVK